MSRTLLIFLIYSCAVLGDLGYFENVFASISTNLHTHVVWVVGNVFICILAIFLRFSTGYKYTYLKRVYKYIVA